MTSSENQRLPTWRRHLAVATVALTIVVLVAIIAAVGWRRFRPAVPVRVVAAATITASTAADAASAPESSVVAQAAGWIEPDPLPIAVSSVIDGLVSEIVAREGETVEAGDVLLRLDPRDAELAVRNAESILAQTQARRRQAEAALVAHEARLRVERARLAELEETAQRLAAAGPGVAAGEVRQAELRVATQHVAIEAQAADCEALAAAVAVAEADVAVAEVGAERARLALERTVVRSSVEGVVMRLLVHPGSRVLAGEGDGALLAELFEPNRLQVRVDVPLADAAKLAIGQPVQVIIEPWPDRVFDGTVTRIAGVADVTRNTLQAKVRLAQPIAAMRPEMLVRARFLAAPQDGGGGQRGSATVAVYAPEQSLRGRSGDRAGIWIVDVDQRLRRRDVSVGTGQRDGWIEIRSGIFPGDLIAIGDDAAWRDDLRVAPERREEP